MNAGERELQWMKEAYPEVVSKSCEDNWMSYVKNGSQADEKLFKDWESFVPGSLAPCHLVVAAIQCMRNKGYQVEAAEQLIDIGLKMARDRDGAALQVISAQIFRHLNRASKNEHSSYWNFKNYTTWEDVIANCEFPDMAAAPADRAALKEQIRAGWYGQLIGGALGTQIEGYCTDNIYKVFGEVTGYLRPPETYNDDITYEIAFLDAFSKQGYQITPDDIAYKWLELIADGYSAEEVALRNLRNGMFPPESGIHNNYYSDWIGAQMRTPIHGMAAPGNPGLAAKLAAMDSCISHSNNGIIGGVFNAILVSLAFVVKDMKQLVMDAIACLPKDSEFHQVVADTLVQCQEHSNWREAWKACEIKFQDYNWIHAYPNAAAEIIALWFGENDFDRTAMIITMAGLDVDCNAGPVLNVLGVAYGLDAIAEKWITPLGSEIQTIMRKYRKIQIDELVDWTFSSIQKALDNDTVNNIKKNDEVKLI